MTSVSRLTRTQPPRQDLSTLLIRIRGEFLEMPGLRLAPSQAARLWALDRETSERALRSLADTGFLWQTADGLFLRVTTG